LVCVVANISFLIKQKGYVIKRGYSLLLDTFLIGVIGAVCAEIFIVLLEFVSRLSLEYLAEYLPQDTIHLLGNYSHNGDINSIALVSVIVIGGLLSGFLVYTFAPEAEGHGTDAVIRAFHRSGGYLRPIVVPIKIIASAITIGTGGAAGREGPAALFSAGIGSLYSSWRKVGWKRRQLFVLIGMASGLSAIFKAPLGTSLFAIEVLYIDNDFETKELIYILFGPLVAYTITGFLFGWQPIFHLPNNLEVTSLVTYAQIVVLGILSGMLSIVLPNLFYGIRDVFRELPIKPHFKPALGALIVGLIALYFPEVLGGGYGFIQESINGHLIGWLALSLMVAKLFAFSFTIGSGGSGGVFAPSLFVGAMLGAFMAQVFHANSAIFAVIAMAAVFGAAARTPLATIVMVAEMTGGYSLLAPTMLGVLSAYILHNILSRKLKPKYTSLYEAQLLNKEFSPAYQMEKVRDFLICHSKILNLEKAVLQRDDILDLMEKGKSVKIGENKYMFFGTFNKKVNLEEGEFFKKYKGADVLYVFRNGKWLNNSIITSILKGDEVLLVASKNVIDKIRGEFESVSQTFSKLRLQDEKIDESSMAD
jgi:CIC family chloride channel protein